MNTTRAGFTIVELLIVIVVIAILAAITIVSYNGIQSQAQNTKILSSIDAYTKGMKLYKVQHGSYPAIVQSETQNATVACLGTAGDFPAENGYQAGSCYKRPSGSAFTSSTLTSSLASVASNLPSTSLPSINIASTNEDIRGILYVSMGTSSAILEYVQKGDKDCGRGEKAYDTEAFPGMTLCVISLD